MRDKILVSNRGDSNGACGGQERQWEQKRFGKWKWGISITISHAAPHGVEFRIEARSGGGGMGHVKGHCINDVCRG